MASIYKKVTFAKSDDGELELYAIISGTKDYDNKTADIIIDFYVSTQGDVNFAVASTSSFTVNSYKATLASGQIETFSTHEYRVAYYSTTVKFSGNQTTLVMSANLTTTGWLKTSKTTYKNYSWSGNKAVTINLATPPSDIKLNYTRQPQDIYEGNVEFTTTFTCLEPMGTTYYRFGYGTVSSIKLGYTYTQYSSSNSFTLDVTSLGRGTKVYVIGQARNDAGESAWCDPVVLTTNYKPVTPTNISVTNKNIINTADIVWECKLGVDKVNSTFSVYVNKNVSEDIWEEEASELSEMNYTIDTSEMAYGSSFKIKVKVTDEWGAESISDEYTFQKDSLPGIPASITVPKECVSYEKMHISWTPVSFIDSGSYYVLEIGEDGKNYSVFADKLQTTECDITISSNIAKIRHNIVIRIKCCNSIGDSSESYKYSTAILLTQKPSSPTNLLPSDDYVIIGEPIEMSWKGSDFYGRTGYYLVTVYLNDKKIEENTQVTDAKYSIDISNAEEGDIVYYTVTPASTMNSRILYGITASSGKCTYTQKPYSVQMIYPNEGTIYSLAPYFIFETDGFQESVFSYVKVKWGDEYYTSKDNPEYFSADKINNKTRMIFRKPEQDNKTVTVSACGFYANAETDYCQEKTFMMIKSASEVESETTLIKTEHYNNLYIMTESLCKAYDVSFSLEKEKLYSNTTYITKSMFEGIAAKARVFNNTINNFGAGRMNHVDGTLEYSKSDEIVETASYYNEIIKLLCH